MLNGFSFVLRFVNFYQLFPNEILMFLVDDLITDIGILLRLSLILVGFQVSNYLDI